MWTIPGFLRMHRSDRRFPQVKDPPWMRPGSGIPSISTAYAQAQCRCAQVIHIFVHSQQGNQSSCRAGRQAAAGQRAGCWGHGGGPGARFRAGREVPGRARMRSCQNPGRRCSPPSWPGRPRRRLPSPTAPDRGTAAWGLACTPGRDLGHRGWQAGGCRRTGPGTRRSGRAESDKAPMYEMGALPSLAAPGPASCLACWRRAPPAGARHPCEGPVPRLLPRSRGRPQGGARFQR